MNNKYILSLDQGTSSSRAILFDRQGRIVGLEQKELSGLFPQSGWVEQDPIEILEGQIKVVKRLLSRHQIHPSQVASVAITNQRETTIVWDRNTGKPIYNAIVWQDRRTSAFCEKLKAEKWSTKIKETTGLVIDAYFSASKIKWILDNVSGARKMAENGDLLFGTVDTWLLWNLTGRKNHYTDYTNASRTMLFDIANLCWSNELCNLFDIPLKMLPSVKQSSDSFGLIDEEVFGFKLPVNGIIGDQQAALFGQMCFEPGMAKNTYGTGCFLLMNTGETCVNSNNGLISTIAWGLNGEVKYAVEGSVFIAGASIKWLRDGLGLIESADQTEAISREVIPFDNLYVVPAFSGLGAPYWDQNARGLIIGITQGVTDKHIVRATLESLAYQSKDLLELMKSETMSELLMLNVDGGASANDFLMQFQADILGVPVVRNENIESTAFGAAMMAALFIEFWNIEFLESIKKVDREFVPNMNFERRLNLYSGWQKAVSRSLNWEE